MTRPSLWHRLPNLHTRIGVALGLLILLLTLTLAGVMSNTAEQQVLRQSAANLDTLSTQMARELSVGMDRFAQAAATQTDRDRFRDPKATAVAMRTALDQFQRVNPEFAYASIVDVASARVLAATGGIFEGGDAHGRPVFERGRLGLFVGDVHDAVRLAELLPKPGNGESLRFLDVAAPIVDPSGKVFRVFAAHVAWQWTDAIRRDIFGPLRQASGVEALLLDTAGKVVLSATPTLKTGTDLRAITGLDGRPAAVVAWPDGGDYLTVVADTAPHGHFPGFGWKVVARQPAALAAAAASHLRIAFLAAGLLLGLVGAVVAWVVTGRLVRPVRLLAVAATNARDGSAAIAALTPRQAGAEVTAVQEAIHQLADDARNRTQAANLSQRQFAVLAESLPQVVFQTDAQGVIEYINKNWLQPAGEPGPLTLQTLEKRLVGGDCESFSVAWRESLASGADLNVRCRVHTDPSQEARWFDVSARAVKSDAGLTTKWVGTLFDVHATVMHAEEARRALEAERAARLDAERMARMRDQFLATVSHELRSPLSVITGWSDILRRKGSDNPMVVKAAEVIRINARLQAALINDLLDITAVMAGKLVLNPELVDLSRVASEVVLSHLHAAQTKGVALVCRAELPQFAQADRRRLSQILSNLIGNAIKFTDAGGSIVVKVEGDGANNVALSVSDTGRGIEADFLPHVFERMRQADSSVTRRAGGLGLGLAIVEGLVHLHGGRVTAQSAGPGHGALFTVTLPARIGPTDGAPARADEESDDTVVELQGQRILLVDDEADAREVAQVALSSLGADVRLASSGHEVLKILESERFDVLVSDVGMPEMDGLTLLRTIRSLPHGSRATLPAVALTAFAMESDRRAGMQAGFQAYVAKPISLRRLSEAVATAMASRGAPA